MRILVQRVSRASVTIDGREHSHIGRGLLVLVGIEAADGDEDIAWLAGKLLRLRIFDDEAGVMNLDVTQAGGDLLVVSQFTLFASTRKGNRPSYIRSAPSPSRARCTNASSGTCAASSAARWPRASSAPT